MKIFLTIAATALAAFCAEAQQIPVIVSGATIHLGNGQVVENGFFGFADGKIFLSSAQMDAMYKNVKGVDGRGKHVYPGLICLNTYVGLNEIDAVRATRDFAEVGELNPNARALVAYNTDSKVTPTLLNNGILLAQIVPQGGLISGSSSVVKTTGWNWEDAAYRADEGIHINWPELVFRAHNDKQDDAKKNMEKELQAIEELFAQAQQYGTIAKPSAVNLRFEAMKDIFRGTKTLYVHVNSARGIISATTFVRRYPGIRMVLVGANDAYKLTGLLSAARVPVILNPSHRLPQKAHEDADQPFKTAAQLMKAGITVAIGHPGSWESRNIMFSAGTAAAYGLTKEEALSCITSNPAKILGIDNTCGTLEKGKDATFIITSGDVLDMRTSIVEQAFINGSEVNLDNQQKQLYRKFSEKYGVGK